MQLDSLDFVAAFAFLSVWLICVQILACSRGTHDQADHGKEH
jgi:hypothetical protein